VKYFKQQEYQKHIVKNLQSLQLALRDYQFENEGMDNGTSMMQTRGIMAMLRKSV
jgi:hypothetical protein